MKTIPAARTAHRVVPAVAPRLHPAEAAVPDRVPQVRAVPAAVVPVPAVAAVLRVPLADRICPVAVVFSDFREGNWFYIRSVAVKVMIAIRTRTIPAVQMTALPAARHQAAVVPHRPPRHQVVQAVAAPRPQVAVPAAHHRAAVPALQVHRMTVRLQAPVIPAKIAIL